MKFKYLYLLLIPVLVLSACKKEYPSLPYADILSFSLKDANGDPLKAAIENGQIIVYWPPKQAHPETISPQVSVADKASVSPASGASVPFSENTSYTVTAENGSKLTYKLKIVDNNPMPILGALYGIQTFKNKVFMVPTTTISIVGDYFDPLPGHTKIALVNNNDQEIEARIGTISEISVNAYPEVPAGNYKEIRIISGGKKTSHFQNFEIVADTRPTLQNTAFKQVQTLKRGAELVIINGTNMQNINKLEMYSVTGRAYIPVILKEAKAGSVTLQIPADLPLGNYNRIRYSYPGTDYYDASLGSISFLDFPVTVVE